MPQHGQSHLVIPEAWSLAAAEVRGPPPADARRGADTDLVWNFGKIGQKVYLAGWDRGANRVSWSRLTSHSVRPPWR